MALSAMFLSLYISHHFDVDTVKIILDEEMGLKHILHYISILQKEGFKDLHTLKDRDYKRAPKLAFEIYYDKEQALNQKMIDLLDKEPIRLD